MTHICVSKNLKRNSCISIQENAFQNVVCEMASISSQPQCVKPFNWVYVFCDMIYGECIDMCLFAVI